MTTEINWELCRSFLTVLNEGSLSAAARALGATQPTLGRHINALELALGTRLFIHAPQGMIPTDTALKLKPYAINMATAAAALSRMAASQSDRIEGIVRVTASEVVAIEVLPPFLADIRRQYPGVIVELLPSNEIQDLLQREADIAVRMLRPQQNPLIARAVGTIEVGMYATRRYLDANGPTPESWEALRGHSVIGYDQETHFIRSISRRWPQLQPDMFTLRSNSDLAHLALIRAGAGIGMCQAGLARQNPELIRVLPTLFSLQFPTWVTMHEDLRSNPACKTVFDALISGMERYITTAISDNVT